MKQFCHSILQLKIAKSKALVNLVMGLASQPNANSTVSISSSPCYHYQFSSISKSIADIYISSEEKEGRERASIEKLFLSLKKTYFPKPFKKFWLLNTDSSPLIRAYSPTLPARRYVYKANKKGKSPVEIGYEFSCVGLSGRRPLYGMREAAWNLPLNMRLIPVYENKNSFTAKQVNALLDNKELPFGQELTVNALDSNYASPEYIADTYEQANLVNVIRLASNRNVWKKLSEEEQKERRESNAKNNGANAIFGQKCKLNEVNDWSLPCDGEECFGIKLASGKRCMVVVQVWDDMLHRSKRGKNMKDKPFRLVRIKLLKVNEEGEVGAPMFKRDLWLGVWGKRNTELSLEEIFWSYRNRFDIEHFFRFGKQKLLLDKFQSPKEESLDNWLDVVSLAYWMLWVGCEEAKYDCPKWQQYDKSRKNRIKYSLKPSPSEVQRQLEGIIWGFEQTPFLPKPRKKGKGRKEGMKLPKKKRYPVIKKGKKTKKHVET